MKKLFTGIIAACMLISGVTVFAAEEAAAEDVMLIMAPAEEAVIDTEKMAADVIVIDGSKLEIEKAMGKMVVKDGVVFAPVRVVLEALGYQVSWADAEQTVMGVNASNNTMIIMQVDNTLLFYTGGQADGKLTMEAAIFLNLEEGRTYIPVKALAEALEYKVGFDTEINAVTLSK